MSCGVVGRGRQRDVAVAERARAIVEVGLVRPNT
jgi:hypothetical protein